MKRIGASPPGIALCLSLMAGCGSQLTTVMEPQSFADTHYNYANWDFLTAENEIFTCEQLDTDRTPLVIGMAGNAIAEPLVEAFAQQHPECQVVIMDITCGDNDEALVDALDNGRVPDVFFTATTKSAGGKVEQHFTDLSDNPVCQKYYTSALQQFDIGGRLYYLPGPSGSFGILYNKTMFAEHGWSVPKTFDEFLGLCRQIEAETGGKVDAFNPNAKYAMWLSNLLLTPSYMELLQKPQDYRWLQNFLAGRATFSGHMEPLFENALTLADGGVLTDGDWSQSASALQSDFLAGKIAMIGHTWDPARGERTQYEFDMFPIPGKTEGGDFIISIPAYAMAVPKPVRPQSPEKKALIDAMVKFVSSGEGQSLLLDSGGLVPSVVDLPLGSGDNAFPFLRSALEGGRVYGQQNFNLGGTNINTLKLVSAQARAVIRGEQTPEGACAEVDKYASDYFAGRLGTTPPELVGRANESLTILETTQLFCDIFREKAKADVAIVMQGATFRGNIMPIYAGDLDAQDVKNLKPRSLLGDSTLIKLEMTGAELLDCLNHPYNSSNGEDYNVVYAFSGLQGSVRPLAPLGEKYVTVSLADGTALEPDKIYTVATWEGMVWGRYAQKVVVSYPETFQEIFTEYLKIHSPISPAKDGRMKLLWS